MLLLICIYAGRARWLPVVHDSESEIYNGSATSVKLAAS